MLVPLGRRKETSAKLPYNADNDPKSIWCNNTPFHYLYWGCGQTGKVAFLWKGETESVHHNRWVIVDSFMMVRNVTL